MRRKVQVTIKGAGNPAKTLIVVTNAPAEAIREWVTSKEYGLAYGKLQSEYYCKVIYDGMSDPVEDAIAIGYDELYDENGDRMDEAGELERMQEILITTLDETVTAKGWKVLDGDKDSFIVRTGYSGPDFNVRVTEA